MSCTDLENSFECVWTGNLTQICDQFYGTEAFDLAGPGVQLSVDIQSLLIVIFGTLQSFISYILTPHASSLTKLIIARLQVIFDTIFGTTAFLSICTMITSYVRLRQTPTAFERIMIQVLLDRNNMCLCLALIARIVQIAPDRIKQPSRRWNDTQVCLVVLLLSLVGPYLKSMSGKVSTAVLSRLCAQIYAEDHHTGLLGYPTVYVPPSGNKYLLFSAMVFFGIIGTAIASEYIRNSFWQWLKKVFSSRLSRVILISMWTVITLSGLGFNIWQTVYLRQTMTAAGSDMGRWDLGQVLDLALWLPTFYQIILTMFISLEWRSLSNGEDFSWKEGIWTLWVVLFGALYVANLGDPPSLKKDPDEEEKTSEKFDDGDKKSRTPELEKSKSDSNEKVSMAILDLSNETRQNFHVSSDEKAPLMQDHDGREVELTSA